MRPISGEPEALTNTQRKPPQTNVLYMKNETHYRVQRVKVQTLQKMDGQ